MMRPASFLVMFTVLIIKGKYSLSEEKLSRHKVPEDLQCPDVELDPKIIA